MAAALKKNTLTETLKLQLTVTLGDKFISDATLH